MVNKSKKRGTAFEVMVKNYLNLVFYRIGLKVDRAPLHGSKDIGDIAGVVINGVHFAIGCKATKELRPVEWMRRGATIKDNAHADVYAEVYKPRGVGQAGVGHAIVMLYLEDFAHMLAKMAGARICTVTLEGGQPTCDECGHVLRGLEGGRYCPGCGCLVVDTTVSFGED